METITTAYGTYTLTRHAWDATIGDVTLDGRHIMSDVKASEFAERVAAREGRIARTNAKLAAYKAAGMSIIRDASDMPRAARLRHRNRVAVVRDGQIIAHYASIGEVPELDTAADADAEVIEPAPAQRASTAAYVEAQTAEIRHGGHILTDGGATQIFDHS